MKYEKAEAEIVYFGNEEFMVYSRGECHDVTQLDTCGLVCWRVFRCRLVDDEPGRICNYWSCLFY